MRTLRIAAAAEAVTLLVLLANLALVHAQPVTSLGGPLHGTAYLVAIATTWHAADQGARGAVWRALIPGVGGLLALRRLQRRTPAEEPAPSDHTTRTP